jgi:hypothetical protein
MDQTPIVSASGMWCGYFAPQTRPGDALYHQIDITDPQNYGNPSLFSPVERGVALTHRAFVTVDVHASCAHEIAVERTLAVELDKGASGGLMERGQSIFVFGEGNTAYQGLLESGHIVRSAVMAPGDQVDIKGGYISVVASPV